ncbi:HU family DNA-binding protein [Prevotella sp. HUN102]|uniref:HU family DNA-binding protein n=1 Tax=Prevotella sp. HUN102 TaxID=1392486 RepID=UPI00048C1C90|nr:HU family DNA-binding protein [Prevotella sp. HUN102]
MAIKYRMYQNKRTLGGKKGFWYARAVVSNRVGIRELSARISDRCTVTESDILAVVSALVKEMEHELKQGSRVTLDGFGSFKVAIHSRGVENLKDFSVAKNIYKPHVIFQPETKVGADRVRQKTFITGLKVEEMPVYEGVESEKKTTEESGEENP